MRPSLTPASPNQIAAAAANTVAGVKGGIVEIPAAAQPWLAGPYLNSSNATVTITLASNVDLKIDAGATLQAIPESSYLSAGATSVSNFITSNNISNFEITGSGTIDGNGAGWWNAYNGYRQDANLQAQIIAPDSAVIAATVESFMMAGRHFGEIVEHPHPRKNRVRVGGVPPHLNDFIRVQLAGFIENQVGNTELPDIVEQRRPAQLAEAAPL